jgi:NAD(P)-dependent dehydrogenase (short-subunit alcohol dehydrogenase family)
MNMSKIWFVTGANSGIGAGVVNAALQAGHKVVATGRNMDKLRQAFPGGEGESLALVQLDITKKDQAQAAVAKAVERFGRVDVLVNNAGNSILGNFEDLSASDFERQLATNFLGVVHVMHEALPVMRKQRAGHIINISSVAGGVGLPHCSAYSASKFAVEGLSMAVAAEVERFGIKLTIVEPGFFRTNLLDTRNAEVIDTKIEDYTGETTTSETWAAYDGAQQGDPLKLGKALVKIAAMEAPLKLFIAGSDAVEVLRPVAQERLRAITDNATLSGSTDGVA